MAKETVKLTVQKGAAATVPSSRIPQAKPDSGTYGSSPVTPEQRQIMICEAAYYIAEHHGFEAGHDMDDWLAAERQVDAALTSPRLRGADSRLQR
jgi:Protein of unknown function (DUF2934)